MYHKLLPPSLSIVPYCSFLPLTENYLEVAPSFLRLTDPSGEAVSDTPVPSTVFVTVEVAVRDSLGKTHVYSPSFVDNVSMIITDIQNCPFIRLPMKLTKHGEDCSPETPIWNLLQDVEDSSAFRATEVSQLYLFDV